MKPISHDATIAMIMSVSPNLNSSAPIRGVVAEADAMSQTMNICRGVCVRWSSGTGATPTVSISPPTLRPIVGEPFVSSAWRPICTMTRTSQSPEPCMRGMVIFSAFTVRVMTTVASEGRRS